MLNFFPLLFLCVQAILALSREEMCSLEVRPGNCRSTKMGRWYYNKKSRTCESFLYSGCGGNANSFETEQECLGTCGDICFQPKYRGYCYAHTTRYFFNRTSGRCEQFVYGGCGGNSNNFWSLEQCRKVCKNECTLPPKTGLCRAMMPRYYYNMETRSCEMFIYGGCSGNANNFEIKKNCEAQCVISIT